MLELIYRSYEVILMIIIFINFFGEQSVDVFILCSSIIFVFRIIDKPFRSIINEIRLNKGMPTIEETYKM